MPRNSVTLLTGTAVIGATPSPERGGGTSAFHRSQPTLPHAVNDGYEIEICIIYLARVNSFTCDVADRPQNIPLLMGLLRLQRAHKVLISC